MRFLSLFAGIGGFDLGLERAGMECAAQVEIDEKCRLVLCRHWPTVPKYSDVRIFCRRTYDNWIDGIEHGESEEWVECSIHRGEDFGDCACVGTDQFTDECGTVDLVCGGTPCQPFSRNGHQEGVNDPRNLWPEMRRIVEELRPAWVVFENVSGAVEHIANIIRSDLEESGYASESFCLEAGSFGADHHRERLFVVANNQGKRVQGLRAEGVKVARPLVEPFLPVRNRDGIWQVEPDLRRSAYGLSSRLDGRIATWGNRLYMLGNAVVPQVAEVIGCAIMSANHQAQLKSQESNAV